MVNVFNVQIFFIVFRETLEAVVVVSVLLAFLKQGLGGATNDPAVYKKLVRQVWVGALLGLLICLILGGAFIGTFYSLGKDIWGNSEDLWEGIFCIIATVLISMMGIAMLRINKMKEKWRVKLAQALIKEPPKGKDRFRIGYLTQEILYVYLAIHYHSERRVRSCCFRWWCWFRQSCTSFPTSSCRVV